MDMGFYSCVAKSSIGEATWNSPRQILQMVVKALLDNKEGGMR
jgi:hypothetical protein